MTGSPRNHRSSWRAAAAAAMLCLTPAYAAARSVPPTLLIDRAADGAVLELVGAGGAEHPELARYELLRNGEPLLRVETSRQAPWSVSAALAARGVEVPSFSMTVVAEGRELVSSSLRYGTVEATWRASDNPDGTRVRLLEMGLIAKDLADSPLGAGLRQLGELLARDPGVAGLEPLHLVSTLPSIDSGRARPAGKLGGYYDCLRSACENEAGGEWSESPVMGGCHCDPILRGWEYCVTSYLVYLIASQRCWLDFLLPLP